jgi:hypothetical protein
MSFPFNFAFGLRLRGSVAATRRHKPAHQRSFTQSWWCSTPTFDTLDTPRISNSKLYGIPTNSFLSEAEDDFEHHARRDEGIRPVCWSSNALPLGSQLSLQVARRPLPETAVLPVNHTATPWRF